MPKIKTLKSAYALDSRGLPAIKTFVELDDSSTGEAVISGNTSNGKYASHTSKNNKNANGSVISAAIDKIEYLIAPKLIGLETENQQTMDAVLLELDGTPDKSRLGADVTLAISVALARAASHSRKTELYKYFRAVAKTENTNFRIPKIITSLVNGNPHIDGLLDFEDFFVVPAVNKQVTELLNMSNILSTKLLNALKNQNIPELYSAKGGFALSLLDNRQVFDIFEETFGSMNLKLGYDYFWGIDVAADNLFTGSGYSLKNNPVPSMSTGDLISYYLDIIRNKHVFYIEDPFASDDEEGWAGLNKRAGDDTIITADSYVSGNPARLQTAVNQKSISAVSLSPIQNGTLTECMLAVNIAKLSGLKVIIHQPAGSGVDNFIADLAIALDADYVNFGPLSRGENVLNYNRLLEIESGLTAK